MNAIFVSGTGTDIGKTFVTAQLVRYLRGRGIQAGALKPVVSGYDAARAAESDPGLLLAAMGLPLNDANVAGISPFRFAAPLAPNIAARREGRTLCLAEIVAFCRARMTASKGPLLIEGVGGLMSPVADDGTGLDLMRALKIPTLLVAGSYLGAVSHTLTAAHALESEGLDLRAVIVNETPGSAVDLEDAATEIVRFLPHTPVITMGRDPAATNGSLAEAADACDFSL